VDPCSGVTEYHWRAAAQPPRRAKLATAAGGGFETSVGGEKGGSGGDKVGGEARGGRGMGSMGSMRSMRSMRSTRRNTRVSGRESESGKKRRGKEKVSVALNRVPGDARRV
jgi:hypothetical protein